MLIWTMYCGFTLSELLTLMKPDAEKHADLLIWFPALKTSGLYVSYIKYKSSSSCVCSLSAIFISAREPFPPDVQQCAWGIKLVQSADLVSIWLEMNTTNNS